MSKHTLATVDITQDYGSSPVLGRVTLTIPARRSHRALAADVHRIWHRPVRRGDLHCSHAELSHRQLLITGGTSLTSNHLGSRGEPITLETLRHRRLAPELSLLETARALGITGLTDTLTVALTDGKVRV